MRKEYAIVAVAVIALGFVFMYEVKPFKTAKEAVGEYGFSGAALAGRQKNLPALLPAIIIHAHMRSMDKSDAFTDGSLKGCPISTPNKNIFTVKADGCVAGQHTGFVAFYTEFYDINYKKGSQWCSNLITRSWGYFKEKGFTTINYNFDTPEYCVDFEPSYWCYAYWWEYDCSDVAGPNTPGSWTMYFDAYDEYTGKHELQQHDIQIKLDQCLANGKSCNYNVQCCGNSCINNVCKLPEIKGMLQLIFERLGGL